MNPPDLTGPLTQFQNVPCDEAGTRKLIESINVSAETEGLARERVPTVFGKWWPDLAEKLSNIPAETATQPEVRQEKDKIDEILTLVRNLSSASTSRAPELLALSSDSKRSFVVRGSITKQLESTDVAGFNFEHAMWERRRDGTRTLRVSANGTMRLYSFSQEKLILMTADDIDDFVRGIVSDPSWTSDEPED